MGNDESYTVLLLDMSPSLHTSIQFKLYSFSELTTLNSPNQFKDSSAHTVKSKYPSLNGSIFTLIFLLSNVQNTGFLYKGKVTTMIFYSALQVW